MCCKNKCKTEIECNGNCCIQIQHLWNAHRCKSVEFAVGRFSAQLYTAHPNATEYWKIRRQGNDDMTFFFIRFILIKIILKVKHHSWIESASNGDNREMGKTISWSISMCSLSLAWRLETSNHFTIPFNGVNGVYSNGLQLQKWRKFKWHSFLCYIKCRFKSVSISFSTFFFNLFLLWNIFSYRKTRYKREMQLIKWHSCC